MQAFLQDMDSSSESIDEVNRVSIHTNTNYIGKKFYQKFLIQHKILISLFDERIVIQ